MHGIEQVLHSLNSVAETALMSLFASTVTASFLALFVIAINLLARKWLAAGQMALLWGLVLIRLAMPFGPESSVSLQNLIQAIDQKIPTAESPVEPWRPVIHESSTTARLSATGLKTPNFNPTSDSESSSETTLFPMFTRILNTILLFLPLIWLAGAVCLLVHTLISHWRFTRKLNMVTASTDERVLQLWSSCCQTVSCRGTVPIVVFDEISQPAVIGLIRPRLLLPADVAGLEENQLRLIMLHELAHLIRRDLWVNWILFGVRLLHWWNPTYWLAATRYCSLREQSRDAMVLRWMKQQHKSQSQTDCSREYSELLLTLAQRPNTGSRWRVSLPVSMLGFLKNPLRKRSLANRLKALRTATVETHLLQKAIVLTVIILIAASGLTDADYPPVEKAFDENWLSQLDVDYNSHPSPSGPLILQVFDLTRPLNKIRELSQRTEEQARQDMLLLAQFQLIMLQEISKAPGEGSSLSIHERPVAKYHEGNQLVIYASEDYQAALQNLFDVWAQSGLGRIKFTRTELTTLDDVVDPSVFVGDSQDTVPHALKKKLNLSDDARPGKIRNSSPRLAVLTPVQKQELILKVRTQPNQRIADHQQLTLFNGQNVLQTLVYHPLIGRLYVVKVLERESPEPRLKERIFEEGVRISLNPTITASQNMLHIQTIIELSEITNVETFKTQVAGKSVSIKTPDVTTRRCQARVEMKSGQSLLIALPPTQKSKFYHYVLFEAEILPETAAN
ncbi:M56 family metallopeptidase [Gimesia sp.]|uniref:M56 family metallopeptidase n=1 Tax=Gimesia sp. TaxID=2024833 RepID=UPI003A8CC6A4